tara:strand:- start:1507 stop:1770 length:264 start_codon:yes stop_codon:yes gene_type:complete
MFRNLWTMLMWKRDMEQQSKWFDKNEPAQARFEENEEWLEELEDRIIKLENDSHPPKDLCEFDSYDDFVNNIKQMIKDELNTQSGQK